ncbi:MAG TPA: gluconeogenesis factor YvcK family protein [Magnetospirillaceae bacterium]|nr:gluconeogenesis factor YvcK family protein [Magnetospirillaceae bacterium]
MSKKLVVIGGGTGSFTLLRVFKNHFFDITALVNMADDGGSTGILRDELGVLPPGDVRQCLVALAREPRVRDLFNYRFDEGTFAGHSFGNLFLTAVEKTTNDFGEAVKLASHVLNITGQVVPMTLDNVTLVQDRPDGSALRGQHVLSSQNLDRPQLRLEPTPKLNPAAKRAIATADLVVIAPGNLYVSLAPALLVPGVAEALAATAAKKLYVCNLVTKPGQTEAFTVADFAAEIERFLGGKVALDCVLYNNAKPDAELLETYAQEGEYWVEYDTALLKTAHYQAIGGHFVLDYPWEQTAKKDLLVRTLIRHDAEAIARVVANL